MGTVDLAGMADTISVMVIMVSAMVMAAGGREFDSGFIHPLTATMTATMAIAIGCIGAAGTGPSATNFD
jgi:hypothetical protein